MATLVNLSDAENAKIRMRDNKPQERRTNLLPEYQGLSVIERAKKAALSVSNNGKCWWVYDYVYRELTWRNPKCD